MRGVLVLSLVTIFSMSMVNGCGFTTHSNVAHRARDYYFNASIPKYQAIVQNHVDAVIGGAPAPDYLYTCGTNHDAGEADHWYDLFRLTDCGMNYTCCNARILRA